MIQKQNNVFVETEIIKAPSIGTAYLFQTFETKEDIRQITDDHK